MFFISNSASSIFYLLAIAAISLSNDTAIGSNGPHGGTLVAVGNDGHHVELLVQDGELVTAMLLDSNQKVVKTDATHLVFTFTEKDGEKEDYKIPAKNTANGEPGFQRKSSHVVKHILRDTMTINVTVNGKSHSSKPFNYPHGPHGGKLVALAKSGFHAELVVQENAVQIHVLDNRKNPTKVDSKQLTLTFTEPDGEKEDYKIQLKTGTSRGTVFERKSKHVVKHVKRDKTTIKLEVAGTTHTSKTFAYPGK